MSIAADTAARNIAYYDQRTSHGSTLSLITHAGVLAVLDPESSWERFLAALNSDVEDVQEGTTREGIHMGVMAGTLDLMQRAYLGTEIRVGVASAASRRLPGPLEELSFTMQFRRTPLLVMLDKGRLTLVLHPEGATGPIKVSGPAAKSASCAPETGKRSSCPPPFRPKIDVSATKKEDGAGVPGSDFRRRRSARRLAARKHGVNRCAS